METSLDKSDLIKYCFVKDHPVSYGQAIYLVGSIVELGNWKTNKGIRLVHRFNSIWAIEIQIPTQTQIQYKFFVTSFDQNESNRHIQWIGDSNSRLFISSHQSAHFKDTNAQNLKIMSFNLRYQNKNDTGAWSWQQRRSHCVKIILDNLPDLIGVQEPLPNQLQYLKKQLNDFYFYYGRPRDLHNGQSCGIFVRKNKFIVVNVQYTWINQTKTPGRPGFGARLPRYFTQLHLVPVRYPQVNLFMFNTHLDHQSQQARRQGAIYIAQAIQLVYKQFKGKNFNAFVSGDFNIDDKNQIWKQLSLEGQQIYSMRHLLPEKESDHGPTFNGYKLLSFLWTKPFLIDHIFMYSQNYTPVRFSAIRQDEPVVSDHYPIVGQFFLKK